MRFLITAISASGYDHRVLVFIIYVGRSQRLSRSAADDLCVIGWSLHFRVSSILIRPWPPHCRFKAVFLDLSLSFLFTAMAFETPFSSLSNEGPDLSLEFLRGFYVDKLRSFEEQLAQKLRNINLPRRSFAQPERSVRLEDVHVSTFVESLGKKNAGLRNRAQFTNTEALVQGRHTGPVDGSCWRRKPYSASEWRKRLESAHSPWQNNFGGGRWWSLRTPPGLSCRAVDDDSWWLWGLPTIAGLSSFAAVSRRWDSVRCSLCGLASDFFLFCFLFSSLFFSGLKFFYTRLD